MTDEEIRSLAQNLLSVATKCYGHCTETASLEFMGDGTVSCYVCPGRYVSRIVTYGRDLDLRRFREYVRRATQNMGEVEEGDIRVASRYAWDLGLDRETDDLVLREAYWSQGYRRTKSDDPERPALFLCLNKDSFFVQPLSSKERLCWSCRK
jgi:hypothetical protein